MHNFGRADQVDREGLKRLVDSINRVLDQGDAVARGAQEIPQIELDRVFELGVVLTARTLSSSPTTTRCPPRMWCLDTKAPGFIEACFRRMKQTGLEVRPMIPHVKLCVLALQMQRAAGRSAAPCHGRALRMNSPPSRPLRPPHWGEDYCSADENRCGFRRSQPSIPTETSHLFRLKPAGHSDGSQPGWRCGLRAATFGSGASRLVKSGGFRGAQFAQ